MDVRREESKNEYFTKYQHRVSYYSHWITNPKLNSDLEFITNTFDNLPQENTLYIYLFVRSMIKMLYVSIKKTKILAFLSNKKLVPFKLLLKIE